MRIVQISDTHLSHLGGPTNDNLERLIPFVNDQLRPDLVVHSGDVLIADPDSAADRAAARELLSAITAPLRVVPGNHDVGEPGDEPWGGLGTTSARVAAFAGAFGPDHWLELGDYAVIGLDSEVLSTGLPEEQAQWDWLETVPAQVGGRPALVFSHKPFWPPAPGPDENAVCIPGLERYRLLRALAGLDVRVFGNGHLHQFSLGRYGDALTVTAPSTGFAGRSPERLTGHGLQQAGVVEYRCEDGGVDVYFRSVPGLAERSPFDTEQFLATARSVGVTFGD
ncbi:MAG TPA: metallophosphoesterase [Streptosporangiaceae bacterium]|nr:metallophosphoesterase [Streptosporangiaceae bacterium]